MLSGVLARRSGLVFGSFTERGADDDAAPCTLDVLFQEAAAHVRGPVVSNAPVESSIQLL